MKVPTEEVLEVSKKLKEESSAAYSKYVELKEAAEAAGEEELKKYEASDELRTLLAKYRSLRTEAIAVTADPIERGDFVWLFRRK